LYGKFGSNPDEYKSYMVGEMEYVDDQGEAGEGWRFSGELGPYILLARDLFESQQRYYNVGTAASITGYVRAFLWRAICGCSGVLYCDTDSIAAFRVDHLPNGYGKELGQWEKEGEFSRAALAGRKLYAMEYNTNYPRESKNNEPLPTHKIACKGVRLTPEEIFEVAKGREIVYEPENPIFSVHKAPHFMNRRVRMVRKEL
jgi:hypothetical protein